MVENAEMFGLSQLHQIRGRLGRTDRGKTAVSSPTSSPPKTAEVRFAVSIWGERGGNCGRRFGEEGEGGSREWEGEVGDGSPPSPSSPLFPPSLKRLFLLDARDRLSKQFQSPSASCPPPSPLPLFFPHKPPPRPPRFLLLCLQEVPSKKIPTSHCILLYGPDISDEATERLKAIRATRDGFLLAERDLALRGPGEVLGVRQKGYLQRT